METCVNKRLTVGAPGKDAMEKVIALHKEYLSKDWHGKLIPKNEATIEEQEELKKLLSDIYEEE